jgi:hypothetical protein
LHWTARSVSWPRRTKRRLEKAGIAYEALDDGVLSCADPERLQATGDGLRSQKIDALLRKWLGILPHPFSPRDRRAGYRHGISILQAEFSLAQMLDRPVTGRLFFSWATTRSRTIKESLLRARCRGPDQRIWMVS